MSRRRAPGAPLRLWLVNQYALRVDQPGITRHATFAKLMFPHGVRTTIFASDAHYWNVAPAPAEAPDPALPTFRYVSTAPVERNGVRRVVSMLSFSARVLWSAVARPPRGETPDVVLGSSPHPFAAVSAWLVARRYRVPFVLEVRDLWPASLVELLGLSERHPLIVLLAWIERFLYRRADFVITLLPGSDEHIRRVAGRPVDVVWLPNGIDLSRVPSPTPAPPPPPFVVMYAGAHGVPNSLETIVDAAAIIAREGHSDVHFVFIGGGKEKPAIMQRARAAGVSSIEFRDAMPKSQLLATLPTAHLLIITFRDTDLYLSGISPNKVFDYFAAARPVVLAVNTPLNPVQAADAGVTTAPEDPAAVAAAILAIAALPEAERTAMGLRGRAYAEEHHDLSRMAQTLASRLTELAER